MKTPFVFVGLDDAAYGLFADSGDLFSFCGLLIFPDVVFVGVRNYIGDEEIEADAQKTAEQNIGCQRLRIGIGDYIWHFVLPSHGLVN